MNQALFIASTMSVFISIYGILLYKYMFLKKDYAALLITKINTIDLYPTQDEQDIQQESFIKFLSDSREMAFDYIDNAQKQIKEFIDIADKEFAFFDSWGLLSEDQLYYENMKRVSEEYKKLRSLLPEEDK